MGRGILEKDQDILLSCQEKRLLRDWWQNDKHEVTATNWEKPHHLSEKKAGPIILLTFSEGKPENVIYSEQCFTTWVYKRILKGTLKLQWYLGPCLKDPDLLSLEWDTPGYQCLKGLSGNLTLCFRLSKSLKALRRECLVSRKLFFQEKETI